MVAEEWGGIGCVNSAVGKWFVGLVAEKEMIQGTAEHRGLFLDRNQRTRSGRIEELTI